MVLYHSSPNTITKFKKDFSDLVDHNGEKGNVLGLWCTEDPFFSSYFVQLQYRTFDYNTYKIQTLFDDNLILDTRKKEHLEIFARLNVKPDKDINKILNVSHYIDEMYRISCLMKEPTIYFDMKLELPSYQIADVLIPEVKKLGFKAMYFSETLPLIKHQENNFHPLLDGKVSCLIFDPYSDVRII